MDLTQYVENLRRELAVAADAGGEDARALAERLTAPLESAIRLMLLDALSAAADEITRELAPGSVELRLRSGEPDFVVTPAPADEPVEPAPDDAAPAPPDADEAATARINLRLPEQLKAGIEQAAEPRAAVRQRLARPRRRRARSRTTTAGHASAAAGSARATPAGCADRASVRFRNQPMSSNLTPQEGTTMPTFDTPEPITATIDLAIGDVRISAGDRGTTVVEVQPSDAVQRGGPSRSPS